MSAPLGMHASIVDALDPLPSLAEYDVPGIAGVDLRARIDRNLRERGLVERADMLRAQYERAVLVRVYGEASVNVPAWVPAPYIERPLTRRQAQECVGIGRVLSPGTRHELEDDAWG